MAHMELKCLRDQEAYTELAPQKVLQKICIQVKPPPPPPQKKKKKKK